MALNNNKTTRALLGTGALALAGLVTMPAQAADAESIIRDRCLSCHTETGESATPFSRISEQRKTPEGWMMTISRMQQQRGLVISPEEKRTLVKYLADTQGLAPSETDGVRYLLEKEPNVVESFDQLVQETCVRCHSGARVALQRRTEDEWKHLIHFHMGQQPTAEFHAGARDRAWFDIALTNVAPKLAKDYPFNSDAWNNWQKVNKKSLNGSWAMTGFMPGKGTFDATLRVSKTAADNYTVALEGQYADGTPLKGEGRAIVYAGYEWRASLTIDGVKVRQVLAASADGSALEGRMFERDDEIIGGSVKAVKGNVITAVTPSYIKQG
ncbi:MAG: quinohemoprotein amine dehydrogenase subunit alpha, partial [Oceanospirillaceae bacterium]|nr:quinohemoprotein amine dehydrogenase subunit alpha [Oceanospirillaceae bacterium]